MQDEPQTFPLKELREVFPRARFLVSVTTMCTPIQVDKWWLPGGGRQSQPGSQEKTIHDELNQFLCHLTVVYSGESFVPVLQLASRRLWSDLCIPKDTGSEGDATGQNVV